MARSNSSGGGRSSGRSSGGSGYTSSGKGSASYGRGVSATRLSQPSGTSLGGYTKVAHSDGSFSMQKDSK